MFLIISSQHSRQSDAVKHVFSPALLSPNLPTALISFRGKKGKAYGGPEPYAICLLTTPLLHFLLISPVSLGFSHSDLLTVLLIHQVSSYMEWFLLLLLLLLLFYLCCYLYLKYSSPKYPHAFLSHLLQISVQILSRRRLP